MYFVISVNGFRVREGQYLLSEQVQGHNDQAITATNGLRTAGADVDAFVTQNFLAEYLEGNHPEKLWHMFVHFLPFEFVREFAAKVSPEYASIDWDVTDINALYDFVAHYLQSSTPFAGVLSFLVNEVTSRYHSDRGDSSPAIVKQMVSLAYNMTTKAMQTDEGIGGAALESDLVVETFAKGLEEMQDLDFALFTHGLPFRLFNKVKAKYPDRFGHIPSFLYLPDPINQEAGVAARVYASHEAMLQPNSYVMTLDTVTGDVMRREWTRQGVPETLSGMTMQEYLAAIDETLVLMDPPPHKDIGAGLDRIENPVVRNKLLRLEQMIHEGGPTPNNPLIVNFGQDNFRYTEEYRAITHFIGSHYEDIAEGRVKVILHLDDVQIERLRNLATMPLSQLRNLFSRLNGGVRDKAAKLLSNFFANTTEVDFYSYKDRISDLGSEDIFAGKSIAFCRKFPRPGLDADPDTYFKVTQEIMMMYSHLSVNRPSELPALGMLFATLSIFVDGYTPLEQFSMARIYEDYGWRLRDWLASKGRRIGRKDIVQILELAKGALSSDRRFDMTGAVSAIARIMEQCES